MEEQNPLRRVWSDDISEIPANSQVFGAEDSAPAPLTFWGSGLLSLKWG